jgi:XRE family aerobic/anaerobic benzoate catabolism transcriptional regulator
MDRGDDVLKDLGDTVRALRKRAGWSRRQLAERTRISERFLADIETGRGNPSVLRLCELAAALGTTIEHLLRKPPLAAPDHDRHAIALLGLRGAGKSTVGELLAARLGRQFVELDARIELDSGLRIGELFELHGEAWFRRAEREALRALLTPAGEPLVLATGGGLVTAPETYTLLREHAHTVWLRARPEEHWTRVVAQGDTRPMANDAEAFKHLCAILAERERLYAQADVVVDTTTTATEDVVETLALRFAFLSTGA